MKRRNFRNATSDDVPLLAAFNQQLIEDEGHRNRMTLPELERRLWQWLQGEYQAILFEHGSIPVAYVLYREEPDMIYLRQFFVARQHRRSGVGRPFSFSKPKCGRPESGSGSKYWSTTGKRMTSGKRSDLETTPSRLR